MTKQRAGLEQLPLHTGEEDAVQREEALTGRGEGGGVCVCVCVCMCGGC